MFDAIILGIIQGITEFIPISSSAHLEFAQYFLGIDEGSSISFTVALHVATLLAVCVVFFKDIKNVCIGFLKGLRNPRLAWSDNSDFRIAILIAIATIPAVIFGLFIRKYMDNVGFSKIGANLFVCGSILLCTKIYEKKNVNSNKKDISDIELWIALAIGIAQAAAVFPGISRSGMTISMALFFGVSRSSAGVFSFLLSIPVILGAFVLEIPSITSIDFNMLIPAFFAAFISGLGALLLLLKFLKGGKLFYFGFYCIIAGLFLFVYF